MRARLPLCAKSNSSPVLLQMSKTFRSFLKVFAAGLLILQIFNNSDAQDLDVTIKFDMARPQIITVTGKRSGNNAAVLRRNLSFLTSVAGAQILGERILNLELLDANDRPVAYKRFIPGEYAADADFAGWRYQVDLTVPKDQRSMARVSWISGNGGILMLDDLLPQFVKSENVKSAKIVLERANPLEGGALPPVHTNEKAIARDSFFVPDITRSVFYIGSGWDCAYGVGGSNAPPSLRLCFLGQRHFAYSEAREIIYEISNGYRKLFGSNPSEIAVGFANFNGNTPPGAWEAETRGTNITILSSDMPFKTQSLQRLHEQLRHEMFHLWIPNGVNLTGSYDWFYEGFALYQSLKLGVAVNRIRFDDLLDTLSRAYDIDAIAAKRMSLIDASRDRWTGASTQVYARGMLAAFLCDLALLERSKGKRSVSDLLREIYEKHRPPAGDQDGNMAVLAHLRSYPELVPVIERNILGADTVDWTDLLRAGGLEAESRDHVTKLKVTAKPTSRQKELLDKLGYNSWRKLVGRQ